MNTLRKLLYGAILMLGAAACSLAWAEPAGEAEYVTGSVQLTSASGKMHQLKKGDAVSEGDTLSTGSDGAAQVRMQDGGIVAIRPGTTLKLDSFKFRGKEDGSEQYFVSLFKGGFRAITGLIGRLNKPSYRITTPTATIGIRGTDHETVVVVPGSSLAATVPPGTYNKVNKGETSLSNAQGTVFILPNQMGYAPAGRTPELQPLNLNIFVVPPPPLSRGGKGGGMRDNAVVDSALLDPNFALGPTLPIGVLFARIPITAIYTLPPQFCAVAACTPTSVTF